MIGKGVCVLDYSLSMGPTLPGIMKLSDKFWPKLVTSTAVMILHNAYGFY